MDFAASPFELKSLDDSGVIEGIGAGVGNVDLGGDRIMPGAISEWLQSHKGALPMLIHHDLKRPIGAWSELREVPGGLFVKGRITLSSRDGSEAFALAKDGALAGLSIGYKTRREKLAGNVRELHAIDIFETSLVSVGMNPEARVTRVKALESVRDVQEMLREGGLSSRKAKIAASAAWKAMQSQDTEQDAEEELAAIILASINRLSANQRGQ